MSAAQLSTSFLLTTAQNVRVLNVTLFIALDSDGSTRKLRFTSDKVTLQSCVLGVYDAD